MIKNRPLSFIVLLFVYVLAGAVANTCLFLFISIPLAEKHQSRKPGFDDYKKETRLFI